MRYLPVLLICALCLNCPAQKLLDSGQGMSKIWKSFGEGAQWKNEQGVLTLKLNSLRADDRTYTSWRAGSLHGNSQQSRPCRISFEARTEKIVKYRENDVWGGCLLKIHGHQNGKYISVFTRKLSSPSSDYHAYAMNIVLPPGMTDLFVEFILQRATGSLSVRSVTMTCDPVRQTYPPIRTKVVGGQTAELHYLPRATAASSPLQTTESTLLFFSGTNARSVHQNTIPGNRDLLSEASGFGTPGEYRRIFVGLHARKDLELRNIRISPLRSRTGRMISVSAVDLRKVHHWAQSDGMGLCMFYSIVPEVLIPLQPARLQKSSSLNLMIGIRIPEQAAPGIYTGTLTAEMDCGERTLPVSLRVLPFNLRRPDADTICYLVHVAGFRGTEEQAVEECREFKRCGFEGIVMACQYGRGKLVLGKNQQGSPYVKSFRKLDLALAGYRGAGMTGPLIIHFSDQLELEVARAMGFPMPKGREAGGVSEAMKTPAFSKAMQTVLAHLKARCRGTDAYFMCIDEPGAFKDRRERAIWECRELQKAGIPAAVYQYGSFWKKMKDLCSLQIFTVQTGKEELEGIWESGVKAFCYGLHGSYGGPVNIGIMPGRARAGFVAHESKFRGQTAWLYNSGAAPVDLESNAHLSFFPLLKYPHASGRLLSTLQWEGICEGITDYHYMHTLDCLLKATAEQTKSQAIARDYARLKKQLAGDIFPLAAEEKDLDKFTNRAADILRWQLALWIMELKKQKVQP